MGRAERDERDGWNPWAALGDHPDIEVQFTAMADRDGWSVPYPGRPVILLEERLTQVERNAALAHELVHLERGWPCQASWAEEERVHDEVARRLVPLGRLLRWVVQLERAGETVEPWMAAEEFHVPEHVAERAMRMLLADIRGRIGRET